MALLTADDVLNKKFQPTKFREGYDQDEVDDFLDEVVNTLRAVYAENEELKAQLAAAPHDQGEQQAPAPEQSPTEEPSTAEFAEVSEEETAEPAPESEAEQASSAPSVAGFVADGASEPESATGMLQLAQRLHDEYVNDGKAEAEDRKS